MVAPGVGGMAGSAQMCGNPGWYLWFCQANKGWNVAVILLQKTHFCNSAWGSALRPLLSSYSLWFPASNPFLICGARYFAIFPLLEDDCNTQIHCLSLPNNWAGKWGCQGMLLELTQHSCCLPQNLFFPSTNIMEMWCALISPSLDPAYFSLVRCADLKYFFHKFVSKSIFWWSLNKCSHTVPLNTEEWWVNFILGVIKEALNQWILWNFKINPNEKSALVKKQILGSTKRKRSPQEGEAPAQMLDVDATCWVPTHGNSKSKVTWERWKPDGIPAITLAGAQKQQILQKAEATLMAGEDAKPGASFMASTGHSPAEFPAASPSKLYFAVAL